MVTADNSIPVYPDSRGLTMELRGALHPLLKKLSSSISEFTFANIYLFRLAHSYRVSAMEGGPGGLLISGVEDGENFFMLPFGLPEKEALDRLFADFRFMKSVSEEDAARLAEMGFKAEEDRDNFDYLYLREEQVRLSGRKFHKKKNLVNAFLGEHSCVGRPLIASAVGDARRVLDEWRRTSPAPGDYGAAAEALELMEELQLCGGIYYVDDAPGAWVLGEELKPDTFAVHFEKGVEGVKGLLQFVNQSFSAILPGKYTYVNWEQDLGEEGLRHAKMSYRPFGFVKKFRVRR